MTLKTLIFAFCYLITYSQKNLTLHILVTGRTLLTMLYTFVQWIAALLGLPLPLGFHM